MPPTADQRQAAQQQEYPGARLGDEVLRIQVTLHQAQVRGAQRGREDHDFPDMPIHSCRRCGNVRP